MKRYSFLLVVIAFLALEAQGARADDFSILHNFGSTPEDGVAPYGQPILSGSYLYGMTNSGNSTTAGTVYTISADGTAYTVIYNFSGGANSGAYPQGSLLSFNNKLYGMTTYGGTYRDGTIFSINTNGTGYILLHTFYNSLPDGAYPYGSLAPLGSRLYGMSSEGGGGNNAGIIFSINGDGTGFQENYIFKGGANDGASPYGSPVFSGSMLYGTTRKGGGSNNGTVFSFNTQNGAFTVLHSFTGGEGDGAEPLGSLILSGSTLYGTTGKGGCFNKGTVFSVNTDGSGFAQLHSFAGYDGYFPMSTLTLSGSTLYGTTNEGGAYTKGTVFSISTSGACFNVIHNFAGGANDGAEPHSGALVLSGSALYGTTCMGGLYNKGVFFKLGI